MRYRTAEVKYPKAATFVRQQNVAYQQQVNNGDPANGNLETSTRTPAHMHGKSLNQSNELLEARYGERLDTRTKGTASAANRHMEAVGTVNVFALSTNEDAESSKLELVSAISKASNSQTKIEESDRRSNDEIQVRLQREFFERYGLYYERKRGEFSDGMRSKYITDDLLVSRSVNS